MIKLSHRRQRTVSRAVVVSGVGFLGGMDVTVRFRPAPPDTGLVFIRTDLTGRPQILAAVSRVSGTARRTTLGAGSRGVTLVEHVLAALAGLRIDNCRIELDGPEPPGLDGSAAGYVEALLAAGIEPQPARKIIWGVDRPAVVRSGGATLSLHPATNEDLMISYLLDYGPRSPIDRQSHTQVITPGEFAQEIAGCRTFLLEEEAEELRSTGLGSRTTAKDLLVFGARGVIENRLRFANEPARHKILDIIGDLALTGLDLRGHVVAYRSGHPLNVALAGELADRHADAAPSARTSFRLAA